MIPDDELFTFSGLGKGETVVVSGPGVESPVDLEVFQALTNSPSETLSPLMGSSLFESGPSTSGPIVPESMLLSSQNTFAELEALESGYQALYGEGGMPDWKASHQGDLNDCSFVATVVALAATDPQAIKDMIKVNADGTFVVTFPGTLPGERNVPIHVNHDPSLPGATTDGGIWLRVLEQAAGYYYNNHAGDHVINNTYIFSENNNVDRLNGPTFPDHYIALLTGAGATKIYPGKYGFFNSTDTYHEYRRRGVDSKALMVATSPLGVFWTGDDEGIIRNHIYTILDYDAVNKIVTLRNPQGPGSLEYGQVKVWVVNKDNRAVEDRTAVLDGEPDGIFKLPLAQFITRFEWFTKENK